MTIPCSKLEWNMLTNCPKELSNCLLGIWKNHAGPLKSMYLEESLAEEVIILMDEALSESKDVL